MKKLLILAFAACAACAVEVRFAWDYDATSNLCGFRFYDVCGGVTNRTDMPPMLGCTVDLAQGEHVLWVTAVATNNIESEPSNTLNLWVPMRPVKFIVVP